MNNRKWHVFDADSLTIGREYACVELAGEHRTEVNGKYENFIVKATTLVDKGSGEVFIVETSVEQEKET